MIFHGRLRLDGRRVLRITLMVKLDLAMVDLDGRFRRDGGRLGGHL